MTSPIIQRLYESKAINEAIGKMQPAELREDLKQEMFIALYRKEEKDSGFIERGDKEGWIVWWLIRTMLNMATSTDSTFSAKFRQHSYQLGEGRFDNSLEFKENYTEDGTSYREAGHKGAEKYARGDAITPAESPEQDYHEYLHRVKNEVEGLHWYEKKVLELYADGKSIQELSKQTGIPKRSLWQTLKNAKEKVKSKLKSSECPPPNCPR